MKAKQKKKRNVPEVIYDVEKIINDNIDKGERYPETVADFLLRYDFMYKVIEGTRYYKSRECSFSYGYNTMSALRRVNERYGPSNCDILEVRKIEIYNRFSRIDYEKTENLPMDYQIMVQVYDSDRVQKGMRITEFKGFSSPKEFYNPDYERNPPVIGDIDYRRTLYWNPSVKTDKTGSATVEFFNNSIGRKIVIDCQGLTSDGKFVINGL